MRPRCSSRSIPLAISLLAAASASAQLELTRIPAQDPPSPEKLVRVKAITDTTQLQPGGVCRLAVLFDIEPGWHIYWKNPGSSGAATEVTVKASGPVTIGPVQYPRPKIITEGDDVTYGYEKQVVLFVPI